MKKVADEFGIKARLISYWIQQEKKKAAKQAKQSRQSKPLKQTTAKSKGKDRTLEHIAEEVQTEPVKTVETDKPVTADKPEKLAGRKAVKTVSVKPQERSDALIIENAILKERIALLNREIEKLRAALTNLM